MYIVQKQGLYLARFINPINTIVWTEDLLKAKTFPSEERAYMHLNYLETYNHNTYDWAPVEISLDDLKEAQRNAWEAYGEQRVGA